MKKFKINFLILLVGLLSHCSSTAYMHSPTKEDSENTYVIRNVSKLNGLQLTEQLYYCTPTECELVEGFPVEEEKETRTKKKGINR